MRAVSQSLKILFWLAGAAALTACGPVAPSVDKDFIGKKNAQSSNGPSQGIDSAQSIKTYIGRPPADAEAVEMELGQIADFAVHGATLVQLPHTPSAVYFDVDVGAASITMPLSELEAFQVNISAVKGSEGAWVMKVAENVPVDVVREVFSGTEGVYFVGK